MERKLPAVRTVDESEVIDGFLITASHFPPGHVEKDDEVHDVQTVTATTSADGSPGSGTKVRVNINYIRFK